jgi:hypothetical protein
MRASGHRWLDPAITGDPGHVPTRPAVAVDSKEHKPAKSGKANEVTHFRPLLEPLPWTAFWSPPTSAITNPRHHPVPDTGSNQVSKALRKT